MAPNLVSRSRLKSASRSLRAPSIGGLLSAAGWLAAAYALVLGTVFVVMKQENAVAGKGLSLLPGVAFAALPMETLWTTARQGRLAVGEEAPDFDLPARDGGSRVRLSALRGGAPVALVFGSYTCPPFRREMPAINALYRNYRDRVTFYFVYIEEAHAHDVWPLATNAKDKITFEAPRATAERLDVVNVCAKELKVELPILVDDMANGAAKAYTAWPTRLYVVDPNGRIAYKSRVGPFGFKAAELEAALGRLTAPGA